MGKRKAIIIAVAILCLLAVIIVFVMLADKSKTDTEQSNISADSASNSSQVLEPPEVEIESSGEHLTEIIKIDEYMPDKTKEEVNEILDTEVSEEQKETVTEAIENNDIPLNTVTEIEYKPSGDNLAAVEETLAVKIQAVFNEFIADAQMGKYEYEKVIPMIAIYADSLKTDIENSNTYSEEELTIISAMILERLEEFEKQIAPYIGYSHVLTEDELIEYGYLEESERGQNHPYQDIIDGTVEEAQSRLEQIKNGLTGESE